MKSLKLTTLTLILTLMVSGQTVRGDVSLQSLLDGGSIEIDNSQNGKVLLSNFRGFSGFVKASSVGVSTFSALPKLHLYNFDDPRFPLLSAPDGALCRISLLSM